MKSLIRPLSILAIIIFVLGIFASMWYIFFNMPLDIITSLGVSDSAKLEKLDMAKRASWATLAIVGCELILGLIIIVFFSIRGRLNENENVIYVEKYIDRKNQQERLNENGSIFYQQNNQEDLKNKLIEIKEKLINSPTKTDEEQFKWLISTLCNTLQASVAAVFLSKEEENVKYIEFLVGYAFQQPESNRLRYEYGEGIAGQVAKEGKEINITSVPQDYIQIVSGLGKATPNHMLVVPIKVENEVKGVVEIASFTSFSEIHLNFIKEALDLIAKYHFTTFVV